MGVADSIFKPHPSNFGKSDIFWRSSNDITITFGKNHYCKSFKKCTQAIRPGVEESLPYCNNFTVHCTKGTIQHFLFLVCFQEAVLCKKFKLHNLICMGTILVEEFHFRISKTGIMSLFSLWLWNFIVIQWIITFTSLTMKIQNRHHTIAY